MEGRSLRRGGLFLLLLAILRLGIERAPTPALTLEEGQDDLGRLIEESRAAQDDEARRSAPLEAGETIDPNRAEEAELDRLPGVGPSTARAIVSEREEGGGFAVAGDLLRVRGIGPSTLSRIEPHLDLSGGVPLELRRAGTRPGSGRLATSSQEVAGQRDGRSPPVLPRIDVNRAGSDELQSLPGIGPALARKIIESRIQEGWFQTPEDLLRVRGIGPQTLARIRGRISTGGDFLDPSV